MERRDTETVAVFIFKLPRGYYEQVCNVIISNKYENALDNVLFK